MDKKLLPVWGGVLLAAILWALMFLPGLDLMNFWVMMTFSATLLGGGALLIEKSGMFASEQKRSLRRTLVWGIGSAAFLYTVFTAGDMITSIWQPQDGKVWAVYSTREQAPDWLIGLLLLIIGPGEEFFWRGFVQKRLVAVYNFKHGYILAALLYAAVHAVSLNPILILAALVCGLFWGMLYRITDSIWTCAISHAVWDVMIFVVLPLRVG